MSASAPPPAAPLWLARHPRVQLPEPLCYGASEVPLEPAHLAQSALALAALLPTGCQLLTSERQRTQALAQALCALRPDLPAWQVEPLLNEMDFGCWEQQPWRSIPRAAIDAWTQDFAQHRFGGRECVADVLARAQALRLRWAQTPSPTAQLWITHAGLFNAWAYLQRAGVPCTPQAPIPMPQAAQWPATRIGFGQWLQAQALGW